jgi:hypothetical protein
MKKLLVLFFIACVGITASAQNTTLPDAVSNAFSQKFPKAKKVKWTPEDVGEYEADFEMDSLTISAMFDVKGNWLITETDIPVIKTPQSILLAIKKNYPKAKIRKGAKIEHAKKGVYYEIEIKTSDKTEDVYFYEDGREMK